ncbi:TPA: T9SS type A sorting domain-containing protein [Candidatus Poribacteria bacterium]|nr:T9SS type A sorting domain-containing protein [Candidatus Poribacteria bacterium]
MKKIRFAIVGILSMLLSISIIISPAFAQVVVSIQAPAQVVPGGMFTAAVEVTQVTDLDIVFFTLHFNKDVLQVIDVTSGELTPTATPTANIENDVGKVTVVVNVPGVDGVTGSGSVAIVHFSVIGGAGTFSNLELSDVYLSDIYTHEIESVADPPVRVDVSCPVVGDVSGNGTISAYDASLILQFVVGIIDKFPFESQSPLRPSYLRTYEVKIPHLTVSANKRFRVPISINDFASITSGALVLTYDSSTLRAINVATSPLLSGYHWDYRIKAGEVRIAFASSQTVSNGGELFYVEFEQVKDTDGAKTAINLKIVQLNEITEITRINGSITILPNKTMLLQNFPNPFNPETWIPYKLASDGSVTIRIYNFRGQLVRTIALGNQEAGVYVTKEKAAYWDGKNGLGQSVASGVYLYSIQVGAFMATRKMVIVK